MGAQCASLHLAAQHDDFIMVCGKVKACALFAHDVHFLTFCVKDHMGAKCKWEQKPSHLPTQHEERAACWVLALQLPLGDLTHVLAAQLVQQHLGITGD